MTPPALAAVPQLSTDERVLESPALEEALDTREKRKNSMRELRRQFKEADERARALIGEFDLQDGEIGRIGKYRIEKKVTPARTVSFETDPKSRITIKADKEA
jgi:hypothetical protein